MSATTESVTETPALETAPEGFPSRPNGVSETAPPDGRPANGRPVSTGASAPASPGVSGNGSGSASGAVPSSVGASADGASANGTSGANGASGPKEVETPKSPKRPRWLILAIAVPLLALIAFFGIRWYRFNLTHVSTDDAQVGGDIYSISPQISGYVLQVPVSTNQLVHKGDLLASIDPREYQQALNQAIANLNMAKAAAAASGAQVTVTRQTTGAGVNQAQAGVSAAQANVDASQTKVQTAEAGVTAAGAATRSAMAGLQAAQHAVAAADAQVRSAQSEY